MGRRGRSPEQRLIWERKRKREQRARKRGEKKLWEAQRTARRLHRRVPVEVAAWDRAKDGGRGGRRLIPDVYVRDGALERGQWKQKRMLVAADEAEMATIRAADGAIIKDGDTVVAMFGRAPVGTLPLAGTAAERSNRCLSC
jgi:hypothetical protein